MKSKRVCKKPPLGRECGFALKNHSRGSGNPGHQRRGVVALLAILMALLTGAAEPLSAQVDFESIVKSTEEVRGLEFTEPVSFERMSKEELISFLKKELSRQYTPEEWRLTQSSLALFGAIPEALVLDDFLYDLMGDQVAGVYDPHAKKMYVVGNLSLKVGLTQVVLEHELTHVLTDQHFDLLSLPIERIDNDDRALAALAIVEGDATISMVEYAKEMDMGAAVASAIVALFMNQDTFYSAPQYFQAWMMFPYLGGEVFLLRMMAKYRVGEDGLERRTYSSRRTEGALDWEVVSYVYRNPPESTEQVLHPEKYVDGSDSPVTVDLGEALLETLGPGWVSKWENTMGEFLIKTLLLESLTPFRASEAAEGWGGDRYLLAENSEGKQALHWKTVWDTEADAKQFQGALVEAVEANSFGGFPVLVPLSGVESKEVSLWIVSEEPLARTLAGEVPKR